MKINEPKILCLFSAPLISPNGSPLDALDVETEKRVISSELASINKRIVVRFRPATIDELVLGISGGFNILHISGHGNENHLLFEDGKGGSQPISGEYLKEVISVGGPFELAIISACHSEGIGKLVNEAGVRHVIAIKSQHPVLDKAAITFIGHFFRNLFHKRSIQKSFELAKLLVKGDPELSKFNQYQEYLEILEGKSIVKEEDKFVLLPEGTSSAHLDPLVSEDIPIGALEFDAINISPTNITSRSQEFTGRSKKLHEVINAIYQNRLVTISGTGGIGKTMVAMEVARWFHSRAHFPDGIFYLDLRKIVSSDALISLIGIVCGFKSIEIHDLVHNLKNKTVLLYFDNAEDLLWNDEYEARKVVDEILKYSPNVKILVTSQRTIGGNLFAPERNIRLFSLEKKFSAQLFAHFIKRPLTQQEWESDSFNKLLSIVGGHPLTIVIMARQLGHGITIDYLLERIEKHKVDAVKLKTLKERDPEHGESLAASLSSAYNFLTDESKEIFQVLSLLPSGIEKFTIEHLFGPTGWECVLELFEAGLVEMTDSRRIYLLPPVQLFASSLISDSVVKKHSKELLSIFGAYSHVFRMKIQSSESKHYEYAFSLEEPNFRSIITLDLQTPESNEDISQLGFLTQNVLEIFLLLYRYREGMDFGLSVLPKLEKIRDLFGEANALRLLGELAVRTHNLKDAEKKYDNALKIFREIETKLGEASTLRALGNLAVRTDDLKDAREKYDDALTIFREIEEKEGEANTLYALGALALRTTDLKDAREKYDDALTIFREIEGKMGEANTLRALGDLAVRTDDLKNAKEKYDDALKIFREIDEKMGEANTLRALGDLAVRTDDLKDAKEKYDDALKIYKEIEAKLGEANTILSLGQLSVLEKINDDAFTQILHAKSIYNMIKDSDGLADVNRVLSFYYVLTNDKENCVSELDECYKNCLKIDYLESTADWLLFYSYYFNKKQMRTESILYLEYAEKFAKESKNDDLRDRIKKLRKK